MTFRNSDPKPLAYLVGDAGLVTECRLVELHPNHLIGFAPELPTLDRTLPVTLRLSLNDTPTNERPGVAARIQGRSLGKDNYVIQIERPEAFWDAATANQTQNRRQAFRVRSEEFGFDRPSSNMEVSAQIEQGPLRLSGEIMNLSLTGCNLRVARSQKEPMPQEGTRALLVLDGPALAEPLRLPCTIQRNFHHAKAPRMGLKFLGNDSPDWLRTEYQLQDYLMQRQRDHLRFRAA